MIVAFIGWDGTGKSTIRTKLLKEHNEKFILIEGLNFLLMNKIKKIILSFKLFKKNNLEEKHKSKKKYENFREICIANIWYSIVFLYYLYYFIKSKLIKKNLLFDRFIYDYLLSLIYLKKNTKFIELLYNLIPKPSLTIFFTTTPKISLERKIKDHDNNLDYYIEMKVLYQNFLNRKNIGHHTIDTSKLNISQSYSKVLEIIKNQID